MKSGLRTGFRPSDLNGDLDKFVSSKLQKEQEAMLYVGEGFINECRNLRTYKDVTGNLRSSVGYVVVVDKRVVGGDLTGDNPVKGTQEEGRRAGEQLASSLMTDNRSTVLIGVAGMEYAPDVEARGKDVITGPGKKAKSQLKRILKAI